VALVAESLLNFFVKTKTGSLGKTDVLFGDVVELNFALKSKVE
jgi:hypothetical protein